MRQHIWVRGVLLLLLVAACIVAAVSLHGRPEPPICCGMVKEPVERVLETTPISYTRHTGVRRSDSDGVEDTLTCTYDLGRDWLGYHRYVDIEYSMRTWEVRRWETTDQRPAWRNAICSYIGW
jgi:hypothetical protein